VPGNVVGSLRAQQWTTVASATPYHQKMKYVDGTEARLGDRLPVSNADVGVVVASIDTGEYSPGYPNETCAIRLSNGADDIQWFSHADIPSNTLPRQRERIGDAFADHEGVFLKAQT
jgi:hypothetical protein